MMMARRTRGIVPCLRAGEWCDNQNSCRTENLNFVSFHIFILSVTATRLPVLETPRIGIGYTPVWFIRETYSRRMFPPIRFRDSLGITVFVP